MKIKREYILVISAIVVLLVIAVLELPDDFLYARGLSLARRGRVEQARELLLRALEQNPKHQNAAEALYRVGGGARYDISGLDSSDMVVVYFDGGRTGPGKGRIALEDIELLSRLVQEYPEFKWINRAMLTLSRLYYINGEYNKALELANQCIAKCDLISSRSEYYEAHRVKIKILLELENYDEALELAEDLGEKYAANRLAYRDTELEFDIEWLKATALSQWERFGEAEDTLEHLLALVRLELKTHAEDDEKTSSDWLEHWEALFQWHLEEVRYMQSKDACLSEVEGHVTADGFPIAGARVYLISEYVKENGWLGVRELETSPRCTTDKNGRFSFDNLMPGPYGLTLAIPQTSFLTTRTNRSLQFIAEEGHNIVNVDFVDRVQLIGTSDNAVTDATIFFRWEPVDGAVSYELHFGIERGATTTIHGPRITDIGDTCFAVDRASVELPGIWIHCDGKFAPESYLGFRAPGTYLWGVRALDDTGNIIADSTETHTMLRFELDDSYLNKADRLFLKEEYREALQKYLENVSERPDDVNSLVMLAKIYGSRLGVVDRNIDEAIAYYRKALSVKDSMFVRMELAELLRSLGRNEEAQEEYERAAAANPRVFDANYYAGLSNFRLGDVETALRCFDTGCTSQYSWGHRLPVLIALLCGDEERALTYSSKLQNSSEMIFYLKRLVNEFKEPDMTQFFVLVRDGLFADVEKCVGGYGDSCRFYHSLLDYCLGNIKRDELESLANELPGVYGDFINAFFSR